MKAKKLLILLPALIVALLLSGCIQTVISLDVKSDLSADIDIKMGILEEYYDMAGGEDAFSGTDMGEYEGFTTSPYTADGFKGFETKGTVQDITDSNSYLNAMFGSRFLKISTDENGRKIVDFRAPVSGVSSQLSQSSGYSIGDLGDYGADMRIIVTLPNDIIDTNATNVSGRTATWDLLKFDGKEMYAYSSAEGGGSFPVWIIIVIIAAAAAVAVFFILRMRKNKAADRQQGYSGYNQSGGYEQGYSGYNQSGGHEQGYSEYNQSGGQQQGYNEYSQPDGQQINNEYSQSDEQQINNEYSQAEENQANVYSEYGQPVQQAPAEQYGSDSGLQNEAQGTEESGLQNEVQGTESGAENAPRMLFCPNCGTKLPENGAFCPGCGRKL